MNAQVQKFLRESASALATLLAFEQGQFVRHSEHGDGMVLAVDSIDTHNPAVKVTFFDHAEERYSKFDLLFFRTRPGDLVQISRAQLCDPLVARGALAVPDIEGAVCLRYGVTVEELRGPMRPRRYARPRMIGWFLMRELTRLSLPRIGEFYNVHHTTVLSGVRRVAALMEHDGEIRAGVACTKELAEHATGWRARVAEQVRKAVAAGEIREGAAQ